MSHRTALLRLAGPLVVSFWIREAFALVDTVYASTFEEGDVAIAAIGLTGPYRLLMIACWVGTSNGLTSHLAAAMGAREGARIEQLKRAATRIILTLSAVFVALAAWIWFGPLPEGRDPALHEAYRTYATMLLGGMAVTAFWSILPDSLVKAHQDMKSTMWAGLLSGITNVVLNTLFVFVFHWGIFGIALGTVLARIASLSYALHRARIHEAARTRDGRDVEPGTFRRPIRPILAIAFPAAITFALMAVETKAVLAILEGLDAATPAVAAWSVFDQGVRFMAMPVIALGVAMLPLVARLWGARAIPSIERELRVANVSVLVYVGLIVLPLGLALAPWFAGLLFENEPLAREYTTTGFRILPATVLAMSPVFYVRSAFEGMQRPRPGLVAAIVRTGLLVLPLVGLGVRFAPDLGSSPIVGAYVGFTVGVMLATALLVVWLRRSLGRSRTGSDAETSAPRPSRP